MNTFKTFDGFEVSAPDLRVYITSFDTYGIDEFLDSSGSIRDCAAGEALRFINRDYFKVFASENNALKWVEENKKQYSYLHLKAAYFAGITDSKNTLKNLIPSYYTGEEDSKNFQTFLNSINQ